MATLELKTFEWTGARLKAAQLVADNQLTNKEIAGQVSVSERTIDLWKRHPIFQEKVREILAEQEAALRQEGLANRQNRIDAMNERWNRLKRVMEARAESYHFADIPGGDTGLFSKKPVFPMQDGRVIYDYQLDITLLGEMRNLEKQAAQDLGQWVTKGQVEASGPGGEPLIPIEVLHMLYQRAGTSQGG